MTAKEVQHALTYSESSPFYFRSHLVVPNVYWGLQFNHELDLLSVSIPAHIGTEIDKKHGHKDPRIRQLYFAGPVELQEAFFEYAPEEAGIITVYFDGRIERKHHRYQCCVRRNPKPRKGFRPFTDKEIATLMRLGNMRYWSIFSKQFRRNNDATE